MGPIENGRRCNTLELSLASESSRHRKPADFGEPAGDRGADWGEIFLRSRRACEASRWRYRFFAELGGILSYGIDQLDNFRRAATYVDRILKGASPSELPVQVPVKFELVINLKTAKALGLAVSPSLLARADAIIE